MKKFTSLLLLVFFASTSIFAQVRETRSVGTFTKLSFRVPGKLYLRQGPNQKVEIEGKKDLLDQIETNVDGDKLTIGKEGKWLDWNWGSEDRINVYITVKNIDAISVAGSGEIIAETKITSSELDLNVSGSGSLKAEVNVTGSLEADVSGSGSIELRGKCNDYNSNVSGSGSVTLSLNISERAEFGVSGSGKIRASGTSSNVKIAISGSGRVLAGDLETNVCNVKISGSGGAEIHVKEELDANISGSGSVGYKGDPRKVNSNSSGSGKVRKM